MSDKAIKLAREYCNDTPKWGKIITRNDQEGILFTGPDAGPGGDFIPFSRLGYNTQIGFFDTRQFPKEKSQ